MAIRRGARFASAAPLAVRWIGTAVLLWGLLLIPSVCEAQSAKLLIEANVPGATIELDGRAIGQTNQDGTALIDSLKNGWRTVTLRKTGHWTASSQVRLEPTLTTTVSLTLAPRPTSSQPPESRVTENRSTESQPEKPRPQEKSGGLRVKTNVANATVLVDGRPARRTDPDGNALLKELSSGPHKISVQKDGFAHATQRITLNESGRRRTIWLYLSPDVPATANAPPPSDSLPSPNDSLPSNPPVESAAPETAELVVEAGVPDATVFVDDSARGHTNANGVLTLQAAPGTHRIAIRKEGYTPTRTITQLDAGTQNTLTLSPTRISSSNATHFLRQWVDDRPLLLASALIGLMGLVIAVLQLPNWNAASVFRWPWSYERFDRYALHSVLQRGEFSTVYRADAPQHGQVALTVLDDPYASDRTQAASFLDKGRTLQQIHETDPDAPLIDVYRIGREGDAADGRPFIVLEHLEGDPLLSHLKDLDTLGTDEALSVMRQVCAGLQVAHANDVHHGHLTPDNVIVTQTAPYRIKLVGFGVQPQPAAPHDVAGTPTPYRAPEQLRDGRSDWRSDMYAAGMLFYKIVTGGALHAHAASSRMPKRRPENPTPPLPDRIPDHVTPVFHQMISQDPDRRPTAARVTSVLNLLPTTP